MHLALLLGPYGQSVTVTFRFLINDVQKGSRVLDDQLRRKKFINLLFGI